MLKLLKNLTVHFNSDIAMPFFSKGGMHVLVTLVQTSLNAAKYRMREQLVVHLRHQVL